MGLLSGQGPVFWANRDANGDPIAPYTWFGDAPLFSLELGTEEISHKESYTGFRAIDNFIVTETNLGANITVDDFRETNLELATSGEGSALAGDSVVDEPIISGVPELGTLYATRGATGRVTGFSLKDNGVAISSTKYSWDASGVFQFNDVSGMTGPITASFTSAASRQVGVFKGSAPEIYTRLYGKNTAVNSGSDRERFIVDVFRNRLRPAQSISFISNEYNQLELTGTALADTTRAQSDPEGQFARFIYLDPGSAVPSASASISTSPSSSVSPSSSASPSA